MLLKKADDKSKRLALLEDLQRSAMLDARQKKWLREELVRLRKGIQGEQESHPSRVFRVRHFERDQGRPVSELAPALCR